MSADEVARVDELRGEGVSRSAFVRELLPRVLAKPSRAVSNTWSSRMSSPKSAISSRTAPARECSIIRPGTLPVAGWAGGGNGRGRPARARPGEDEPLPGSGRRRGIRPPGFRPLRTLSEHCCHHQRPSVDMHIHRFGFLERDRRCYVDPSGPSAELRHLRAES
jgi:hypothetical protein